MHHVAGADITAMSCLAAGSYGPARRTGARHGRTLVGLSFTDGSFPDRLPRLRWGVANEGFLRHNVANNFWSVNYRNLEC